MSSFSSFEKDKKIFDDWRTFLIEQEEGRPQITDAEIQERYKVSNISEVKNLGQLIYFIDNSNLKQDKGFVGVFNKLKNVVKKNTTPQFRNFISKTANIGLGTYLGVLTGGLAPIAGGVISGLFGEAILAGLGAVLKKIESVQVPDDAREKGSIQELFDLDDELLNFLKDKIGDKESSGIIIKNFANSLEELVNKKIKASEDWRDTTVSELVNLENGKYRIDRHQFKYASDKYGLKRKSFDKDEYELVKTGK